MIFPERPLTMSEFNEIYEGLFEGEKMDRPDVSITRIDGKWSVSVVGDTFKRKENLASFDEAYRQALLMLIPESKASSMPDGGWEGNTFP
jgi:hypothetical protein